MKTARLPLLFVTLLLAAPAAAMEEQIIDSLTSQGYSEIRISKTWLGRVRIVANGPQGEREIVFNPANGVVMRDYLTKTAPPPGQVPPSGQGRSKAEAKDHRQAPPPRPNLGGHSPRPDRSSGSEPRDREDDDDHSRDRPDRPDRPDRRDRRPPKSGDGTKAVLS